MVSQQLDEIESVRGLKVVNQVLVNVFIARSPLSVTNAELVDDGGLSKVVFDVAKVVAQIAVALLADVVHVDVTSSLTTNLDNQAAVAEGVRIFTSFDVLLALSVGLVHLLNDVLADQTVGVQVRSIRLVLDERINQTVTNSNGCAIK